LSSPISHFSTTIALNTIKPRASVPIAQRPSPPGAQSPGSHLDPPRPRIVGPGRRGGFRSSLARLADRPKPICRRAAGHAIEDPGTQQRSLAARSFVVRAARDVSFLFFFLYTTLLSLGTIRQLPISLDNSPHRLDLWRRTDSTSEEFVIGMGRTTWRSVVRRARGTRHMTFCLDARACQPGTCTAASLPRC
jgi:hypothetical protein